MGSGEGEGGGGGGGAGSDTSQVGMQAAMCEGMQAVAGSCRQTQEVGRLKV